MAVLGRQFLVKGPLGLEPRVEKLRASYPCRVASRAQCKQHGGLCQASSFHGSPARALCPQKIQNKLPKCHLTHRAKELQRNLGRLITQHSHFSNGETEVSTALSDTEVPILPKSIAKNAWAWGSGFRASHKQRKAGGRQI